MYEQPHTCTQYIQFKYVPIREPKLNYKKSTWMNYMWTTRSANKNERKKENNEREGN